MRTKGVRQVAHLAVSVVIPTYNRARLLQRPLRSALSECRPGDEIIVVDDGSTDATEKTVRSFGPAVRYVRGEHRGAGAARNAGVAAAAGDLVAFLDSDDEWIPGKLAWQRAILERFPDILFVFSDFGGVRSSGERLPHQGFSWHGDARPWDEILGPGIASSSIAGMPTSAPPFKLHVGRLYEECIRGWYVYACTVLARRKEAGDALHFAEDVAIYEDVECFARMARRGLAGYMDCDTAWQHGHTGARLTDADPADSADAAVKIIERIWGADAEYLRLHSDEYESVVDRHRLGKARYLIGRGRRREARQELARCFRVPRSYSLLTYVPGGVMRSTAHVRRRVHSLRP